MRDLFAAELLRFRTWALAYALAHLALLAFYGRLIDPLQQPTMVYQVTAALYLLSGLLLGLYQMGGYRRPNTWLNLLHRPVAPPRIAVALTGAGAAWLAVAIALPLALLLLGQQGWTARVVDVRHWGLPIAAWLVATCGYLAGAYAMLAPRRYSACVMVLLALLVASQASGIAALAVQALLLGLLLMLMLTAFRPDLSAPPPSPAAEALTALPVVAAMYALLVAGGFLYQIAWIASGSHPLNSTPPPGGFVAASRAEGPELMAAALARSKAPEALLWTEQVRLSEVLTLGVEFEQFPVRHQLTNVAPMEFDDEALRIRWIFSHDSLTFHGQSLADRGRRPALGQGEAGTPFAAPMLPVGKGWLVSASELQAYDEATGRVMPRLALPAGEVLAGAPAPLGESLLLLSDRALYFYDARAFADEDGPLSPRRRLALPGAIGALSRVDLIELLDGHLVSFVFGRGSTDGPGDAWQELWRMDGQGRASLVATRALAPDFPLALRHAPWWLSPGVHEARSLAVSFMAEPSPLDARETPVRPPLVQGLALALMATAFLLAAWYWRGSALPVGRRLGWLAACALLGLPALLALRLLHGAPSQLVTAIGRPHALAAN